MIRGNIRNGFMANKAPHGPQGIIVWQGYRSEKYKNNRDKFIKTLSDLFIPRTVQVMEPIGLCNYFPTILPDSNFTLPDEISLVSYSSKDHYQEVIKATLASKVYDALRSHIFNFSSLTNIPQSKSDFPLVWESNVDFGQPYYLCDSEINWRDNKTKVYCAKRLPHIPPKKMLIHIEKTIAVWRSKNTHINGSILVCEKDFVLYWEHTSVCASAEAISSLFPLFAPVLQRPIISRKPAIKNVSPLDIDDYNELFAVGCSLDIRLQEKNIHTELPSVRLKVGEMVS